MTAGFSHVLTDGRAGFPALLAQIETYLAGRGVPQRTIAPIMIAFDEIVSNALDHGGAAPVVTVSLDVADGVVMAQVTDTGRRFDPLSVAAPDTALSVEDRAIGGLGIHLVRELMDTIDYRYEAGVNRLRFSKDCAVD